MGAAASVQIEAACKHTPECRATTAAVGKCVHCPAQGEHPERWSASLWVWDQTPSTRLAEQGNCLGYVKQAAWQTHSSHHIVRTVISYTDQWDVTAAQRADCPIEAHSKSDLFSCLICCHSSPIETFSAAPGRLPRPGWPTVSAVDWPRWSAVWRGHSIAPQRALRCTLA